MASRPHAVAATGALVLALAVTVVVASRGNPAWTLVRSGPAYRPAIFADVVAFCVIGTVVAAIITLSVHRTVIARQPGAPSLASTLLRAVPATTLVLTTVSLLMIARMELEPPPDDSGRPIQEFYLPGRPARPFGIVDWRDSPVRAGDGEREERTGRVVPGAFGGVPQLPLLVGIVLLLVFAGALTWAHNNRTKQATGLVNGDATDDDHDVVRKTVVGVIDAMLADPDPNTAIIGAYARLLEGLDAWGSGRREYEAPMEHLSRVLSSLRVRREPLHRLIKLFQLARFSTRPLNARHREQALDALHEVAHDLSVVSRKSDWQLHAR